MGFPKIGVHKNHPNGWYTLDKCGKSYLKVEDFGCTQSYFGGHLHIETASKTFKCEVGTSISAVLFFSDDIWMQLDMS